MTDPRTAEGTTRWATRDATSEETRRMNDSASYRVIMKATEVVEHVTYGATAVAVYDALREATRK